MNRNLRLGIAVPPRKMGEEANVVRDSEDLSAKSPCSMEISNDVPNCNLPRFYSKCSYAMNDFPATSTMVSILFDYELHYINKEPPIENFEGMLLDHLSTYLELDDCRRTEKGEASKTMQVIGISADPGDRVIPETACQVPVEKDVSERSSCSPIQGQVTLFLSEAGSSASVVSAVLRELRSAMNADLLAIGTIKKVVFMGQRFDDEPPPVLVSTSSTGNVDNSLSSVVKGLLGTLLILGVLLALLFKRRRVPSKVETSEFCREAKQVDNTPIECKESTEDAGSDENDDIDLQAIPTSSGISGPAELLSDTLEMSSSSVKEEPNAEPAPTNFLKTIDSLCKESANQSPWVAQDNHDVEDVDMDNDESSNGDVLFLEDDEEDLVESLRKLSPMKEKEHTTENEDGSVWC